VARRFALAIDQTSHVRGADDRRDLIVAVYEVLCSAHFPWHCKTDRAININTVAHVMALYSKDCVFMSLFAVISTVIRTV
jgi:hypothetical protein